MARTFKDIEIEGKKTYALFDIGSLRSYIRKEFASEVKRRTIPFKVGLGGSVYDIDEICLQICAIDGLEFDRATHPVEEIGLDERGKRIEAIIGALGMEKLSLIPDPKTSSIDMTMLRKREFIEF